MGMYRFQVCPTETLAWERSVCSEDRWPMTRASKKKTFFCMYWLKVSKDHLPAAQMRARVTCLHEAVAPPAHINWPPMDLVKKEHSWAINQEWGGWSFQCAAKAQGVCGNSGLRMQGSGWKAQMLLLKSTRLSGSDKPPLSLWPYLCHFMTFCSTPHACMHTRI